MYLREVSNSFEIVTEGDKMSIRKSKSGFTLVELIVVLVILAILAAVLVPTLVGYIDKANKTVVLSECRLSVVAAQSLYSEKYADGGDVTTDEIEQLAEVEGAVSGIEVDADDTLLHLAYTNHGWTVTYCRNYETCPLHDEMYTFDDSGGSGGDPSPSTSGGSDPSPSPSGTYYQDTTLPVLANPWPASNSSGATVPASGVFEYNGSYYVFPASTYIDGWTIDNRDPSQVNNWGVGHGTVKLSGKVLSWDGSSSLVGTDFGDVINWNGTYYVFTNHNNGAGYTPTNSSDWYLIPKS